MPGFTENSGACPLASNNTRFRMIVYICFAPFLLVDLAAASGSQIKFARTPKASSRARKHVLLESRFVGGRARVCKRTAEIDWKRVDCWEAERDFIADLHGYDESGAVVVIL
jgi:hypothetical protein